MQKKFNVMMLAFETEVGQPTKIREVTVPDFAENARINTILNSIYHYGQNDFQPQKICSVSVGDVIVVDDRFYLVASTGFRMMTAEQLETYCKVDRRDRYSYKLGE